MLAVSIADEFVQKDLSVSLGCLTCRVAVEAAGAGLDRALAAALERRRAELSERPVAEVPEIAAARQAYKALGKDPSRYRPSSEALFRRLAQGKDLFRINNVVDTNNLVSLETGYAAGSYSVDRLRPPIVFRPGRAGESYGAIGRGPLNLEHLPLFADAEGPFGSPTSDSERTMIRPDSADLLMVVIAFGEAEDLAEAMALAARHLAEFCHGEEIMQGVVTNA